AREQGVPAYVIFHDATLREIAATAPASVAAGPAPTRPAVPEPVAPEDDTPEDDDPDLNESALSGYELIVRELGATVVEEFTND
ncbi:HRDC domain-containing protein, partial [Streptomyces sp. ME08-AFT2]|uniref:HRDC domain-containing protein n=1 Tax=Streptomyces sp. ME08-AFT2 TaxID=3028683 RepID=UPI0029B89C21